MSTSPMTTTTTTTSTVPVTLSSAPQPPVTPTSDHRMAARGSHWSFLEKARFEAALHKFGPFAWRAIIRAVGTRSEKQVKAYAARYRRRKKLATKAAIEAFQDSVTLHQNAVPSSDGSTAIAVAPAPSVPTNLAAQFAASYALPVPAAAFATAAAANACAPTIVLTPVPVPFHHGSLSTSSAVSTCSSPSTPKVSRPLRKARKRPVQNSPSRASITSTATSATPRISAETTTPPPRLSFTSSISSSPRREPCIDGELQHQPADVLKSNSADSNPKLDDITETLMLLQQSLQSARLEKKSDYDMFNEDACTLTHDSNANGYSDREPKNVCSAPSAHDMMMQEPNGLRPNAITQIMDNEYDRLLSTQNYACGSADVSEGILDDGVFISENNSGLLPSFVSDGEDDIMLANCDASPCSNDPFLHSLNF